MFAADFRECVKEVELPKLKQTVTPSTVDSTRSVALGLADGFKTFLNDVAFKTDIIGKDHV